MKKLLCAVISAVLIFSSVFSVLSLESQDKITAAPEILSFTASQDMTRLDVSFSHSLSSAEELRKFIYGIALDEYGSQEALMASPEKYLCYETQLFLEISENSLVWSVAKKLSDDGLSLTADYIKELLGKTDTPPQIFIRISLASENILEENTEKVYIYAPSDAVAIYIGSDGTLIPTGKELIFPDAASADRKLFAPQIKGYIFDGWSADGESRINSIPKDTVKTVIKAHFIPMKYEINYVLTTDITYPFGRADNTKNPTQYEVGTETGIYSIDSPVIGYTFGGWYASPDFSGERVTKITAGETGDRILYARWISDEEKEHQKYLEQLQYIKDNCFGDPDGDGTVTAADARYVLRAAVGLEQPQYEKLKRVDYFNTNKISSENARITLRISVGLDSLYDILLENGLLP